MKHTEVWYTSGAPGSTTIPIHILYAMYCATKRGEASVRFKDTSHRRMIFFDISYLDPQRTFGVLYSPEDCAYATR